MIYKFTQHSSRLASLMVALEGGMRSEHKNKYPNGMAHFSEHLHFKGSEKYSSKEMLKDMARYGAAHNAFTSEDLVAYYITLPEENIEKAFELLSQIVLYPIFPEEEVAKELGVVCQEIRMYNDNLGSVIYEKMKSNIFSNYLGNPIQGTEDSVRSITTDDIKRFDRDFYNSNMIVSLASNKCHGELVNKYFGDIDNKFELMPVEGSVYNKSYTEVTEHPGFEQSELCISFAGPRVKMAMEDRISYLIFDYIFGGGTDSRLWNRIREDLGLVYGISSYFQKLLGGSIFGISTSTQKENIEKILAAVDAEIKNMKEGLVDDDELLRAKNMMRSSIYKRLESSQSMATGEISSTIYNSLRLDEVANKIDQVTKEDVLKVSDLVFGDNKYVQIGVGTK